MKTPKDLNHEDSTAAASSGRELSRDLRKATGVDAGIKTANLKRLRRIEGQIRGLQRMVEEDVYCMDVLKQTMAVQRAVDKINGLILENHLHTCVTTAIRSEDGNERERVIGEIVDVFAATSKL